MNQKLKGKVAIVTGAGRGLGRASAIELAKEGASLVIFSRNSPEIKETSKIIKEIGSEVIAVTSDISVLKDVKKVIDKAVTRFRKIDILVNNAAILGPVGPFFKISVKEIEKSLDINLKGTLIFSRLVVPYMIKQRRGKIINVISSLGTIVTPFFSIYSVAKAGVIHYTKILAEELKDYNIQVNGLDPGVMDTEMQRQIRNFNPNVLGNKLYKHFTLLKEKGHLNPPEKIARLVVLLASRESMLITGKIVTESNLK